MRLVGVLKWLAYGKDEFEFDDVRTVRDIIERLKSINRKLYERVYDECEHELKPDIYIAVNDVDIRLLNGVETEVHDGDVVLLLAYIHGG